MDYAFDLNEFLKGFDVQLDSELVYFDSDFESNIATLIDSETGELLIIETLH